MIRSGRIYHWIEGRRRLVLLVLVLVSATCAVGAVSTILLYRVAYREQERSLGEQASLWAYMIEAVAHYDSEHNADDVLGASPAAALLQVRAAYDKYTLSDHNSHLAIAHLQDEYIAFLLHEKSSNESDDYVRIPIDSPRAAPMRRALAGESGTIVGQDYRGIEVLAAYEPVPTLNLAVVAKIDLAQIRAPFVHERLYRSDSLAKVDFLTYVLRLTHDLKASLLNGYDHIAVRQNIESVDLDVEKAVPCGLIINELLSNALKHAFPNGERGEIYVEFYRRDDQFCLIVRDDGVGLPADRDLSKSDSLGLKLVHILTRQMLGEIKIDRVGRGLRFVITIPAPNEESSKAHG